ncbi:hypothetical protein BD414DRAFT_271389 [Trametes punicea]|nr:hypothetical protein BD414DRAFT_271389 [Trametes punicea]
MAMLPADRVLDGASCYLSSDHQAFGRSPRSTHHRSTVRMQQPSRSALVEGDPPCISCETRPHPSHASLPPLVAPRRSDCIEGLGPLTAPKPRVQVHPEKRTSADSPSFGVIGSRSSMMPGGYGSADAKSAILHPARQPGHAHLSRSPRHFMQL